MGEHTKLLMLEAVLGEMRKENLLGQVRETGAVLLSGLEALEVHKCNQRMKQNQSCVVVFFVEHVPFAHTQLKRLGIILCNGLQG